MFAKVLLVSFGSYPCIRTSSLHDKCLRFTTRWRQLIWFQHNTDWSAKRFVHAHLLSVFLSPSADFPTDQCVQKEKQENVCCCRGLQLLWGCYPWKEIEDLSRSCQLKHGTAGNRWSLLVQFWEKLYDGMKDAVRRGQLLCDSAWRTFHLHWTNLQQTWVFCPRRGGWLVLVPTNKLHQRNRSFQFPVNRPMQEILQHKRLEKYLHWLNTYENLEII